MIDTVQFQDLNNTQKDKDRKFFIQNRRYFIFFLLLALVSLGILIRYALLMLGTPPPQSSVPRRARAGERGLILDRNGRILAMETRLGNISVWRPEISDLDTLCTELAPALEMPPHEIRERIETAASDFVYLKKQVDQSTMKLIELGQDEGRFHGVTIEPIVGRIYPEGELASQIIGFAGDDNNGLGGIEYAFNEELSPKKNLQGENANGGYTDSGTSGDNGGQVILTIDANVQFILQEIGEKILVENEAEAVMFMAMDPRTGDILGSASLPGFDPNMLRSSTEITRMDRPSLWAYEPGSVFKVFSLSALMESGSITGNTVFICDGHYEKTTDLGERVVIKCLGAHGRVTAREIIVYSCNAGAAYAADRLNSDAFYQRLRDFGFGGRTQAGTPGETGGFLRSVERWSGRSKPTISMGQEIAVSALQMIQAASAIANDGILVPPRFVSMIRSPDGKQETAYRPQPPRRILSAETARAMRSYMMAVTSDIGTGWRANVEDLSLAVKTGTAQIIDPETGAYSDKDFIASCIALLPAESPSLVLYLVIIKPQGLSYLGGRIASPPIREAAEALVDYLGIPRGRNPQIVHSGTVALQPKLVPDIDGRAPDLLGYSKAELIPLLLRDDLNIEFSGEGWVVYQEPAAGTPLEADTVIRLELE
ncbi:MAG: transpeptidase family protein [Treponema sp.]|jgi:cell division protein FtsI (penicillin-binding protein 3)|nr:transpeptidase family protein [Treponema sp.]